MNKDTDINYIKRIIKYYKIIFISLFFLCSFRLLYIAYLGYQETDQSTSKKSSSSFRYDILDRHGNTLALNIPATSVYIKPNKISDRKTVFKILTSVLKLSPEYVNKLLDSEVNFAWVKRDITDKEELELRYCGSLDIYFQKIEKRFYPYGNLFAHIVGMTDVDNNGISAIEKNYNKELQKQNIYLSVDLRLQTILHEALTKAKINNQAKEVFGIIVDPNTSEVVAMVSLPDFNPNDRSTITNEKKFNYVTQGVYEFGSIMKPITVAMALDNGSVGLEEVFDVSKPIVKNSFLITDYSYINKPITIPEILMYSSNIGTYMLARQVGANLHKEYLNKLGMLNETTLEIPEKSKPIVPKEFNDLNSMTISYGYGIAMSQATFINAFATIINGGVYRPLTFLKSEKKSSLKGKQVINPTVSAQLRGMLRLVVANGFGKKAQVKGYSVGGKTGSSEVNINGVYYKNLSIASFISFFPSIDPKYVMVITVKEPKRVAYNNFVITGGYLAAPVTAEILYKISATLGISTSYDDGAENIDNSNQTAILDYVKSMPINLPKR